MTDCLRPRGTVEVVCSKCGWSFWVEPLDPRLPGPMQCVTCEYPDAEWPKAMDDD